LTKLLATPYEKQNDFSFTVIFHKNSWYLCELETEKQEKERINASDKTKQFCYWGHKFESYVTAGKFLPSRD
jgi:RAT1-interacting protein